MTDTEKAALERRIDELCAEVEAEKQRNAKLFEATTELVAKAALFEAENAKLRELVRDAWGDGHPDRSCDGCDIRDECHDDLERMRKDGVLRYSRCLFELRIEDRMRELGIEVE